jgi:hypothetical protein
VWEGSADILRFSQRWLWRVIFWDITPYSPLKINPRFGGTCRLHIQGRKISQIKKPTWRFACYLLHAGFFLCDSSALKMESACSSETSVDDFYWNTVRYIPEDRTLHTWLLKATLKMEAAGSSKTLVNINQTHHHITSQKTVIVVRAMRTPELSHIGFRVQHSQFGGQFPFC